MKFFKMHGLGNDFVVLDWRHSPRVMTPERARQLADRRFGVGCDQIITLLPPTHPDATLKMQINNADGGAVGMCGNAARCVAGLLQREIVIETITGLFPVHLEESGAASVVMGLPKRDWQQIPLAQARDTNAIPLDGFDLPSGVAVNVGNPHIVFFVEAVMSMDVAAIGPKIEHHPLFPERINVEFVQVLAPDHLRMRVWERGTGITAACGTGATASFVAARARGLCSSSVRVEMDGGTLLLKEEADGQIRQTGAWTRIFEGEWYDV